MKKMLMIENCCVCKWYDNLGNCANPQYPDDEDMPDGFGIVEDCPLPDWEATEE
jgi:hypothetical protein